MDIATYIHALTSIKNIDEITDIGVDLTMSLGCDYFLYAGISQVPITSPQVTLFDNYPPEWMLRYQEKEYVRIDPTVLYATQQVTPHFWCDLEMTNAREVEFFQDAANHGIVSGVTIPLHSARGYTGIIAFSSSNYDAGIYKVIRSEISHLLLFGYRLHELVIDHLTVSSPSYDWEPLSEPERKCMLWAAEGKTAWEIGTILSLKERTVIFHLNNATIKLRATNRQHAIARAIALGEIRTSVVTLPDKIIF